MWNSSCRTKTHSSLPRQPSHGEVSFLAEYRLIGAPLMRILDHLPPIKMLSKEPCTCIVMPRWHCRGTVQGHCMPCTSPYSTELNWWSITTLATAHPPPGKPCEDQDEGIRDSVVQQVPTSNPRQSRLNNALGYQQNTSSSWYVYINYDVPKLWHSKSWGSVPDQPAHEC